MAAQKEGVFIDLIDCAGNVLDREKQEKLTADAAKLEERVRSVVGLDNFYVDPPPPNKVPKIIDDILEDKEDKDNKKKN
jgi:hypothetical protein